jgi:hypothetical protein
MEYQLNKQHGNFAVNSEIVALPPAYGGDKFAILQQHRQRTTIRKKGGRGRERYRKQGSM